MHGELPLSGSETGASINCCLSRAILHDSSVYPEPDAFKPERFLDPDGNLQEDPISLSTFGCGRRSCPGRHFVDVTLFITVASLFSVFSIQKVQGSGGRALYLQLYGLDREVWLCPSERDRHLIEPVASTFVPVFHQPQK
jgi:hypothetical protein